ncbi:MAG TPA: OmpH family outer membrane protein [Steroidobacteraceae bacterium]|nr:OmpH family outer membrane protein [Steroidobacteraceae bacterium]
MRFKWWVGFVATVGTLVASPAWADLKIGVVDYGRLVEESPQAKTALEAIRTEFTPRQRDLQNQQATLKTKEDKLQKDGATMSQDQRTNSEKDLRDSYRELQRKQGEVQEDFNARRNEEMSRLQKTLIEQVRVYAKAQNFDLVIADGVIYTTPTIDITPAILAQLQANPGAGASHAKAAAPATAPAAPAPAKPPGK